MPAPSDPPPAPPSDPRRLLDLIDGAIDLPTGERTRWLRGACGDDEALVQKVRGMLDAGTETPKAAGPSGGGAPRDDEDDSPGAQYAAGRLTEEGGAVGTVLDRRLGERLQTGDFVGPYELIRPLGSGGMGVVWLGQRPDLEMKVAVKVIKRGMDTDEILQRFRMEQRVLAGLHHPGIARLLDAGVTESQAPYLVMEFVEGATLAEAAGKLTLRQRLELFREVCSAVEHAHRALVVHRDLKPANILVKKDGKPMLLDFGIAKLLEDDAEASGLGFTTQTGHRPLTPRYASPEQVRGEPVSTATDVYALGTILYELLSGTHPHGETKLAGEALAQAVCLDEPQKPSLRAAQTNPKQGWSRELRGDLDTITLVALRKEPERRYGSVERLSEDVRRHLDGFPVAARADTAMYRARKYFARNWKWLSAAAVFISALLGSLAWITLLYRDVSQARSEEMRQAAATRRAAYAAKVSGAHPRIVAGEGMRALEGFADVLPNPPGWEWDRLRAKADRSLWRGGIDNSEKILDWFERPRLYCAAISSSGRYCALGCHEHLTPAYVRILETKTGRHVRDIPLGDATPTQVAFVAASDLLVIGKGDASLALVDAGTGEILGELEFELPGHIVHHLAINGAGQLAVTYRNGARRRCTDAVSLYDGFSLTPLATFDALTAPGTETRLVEWSPDGRRLAVMRWTTAAASIESIDIHSQTRLFRRELEPSDAHAIRWIDPGGGESPSIAAIRSRMQCPVVDGATGALLPPLESGNVHGCVEVSVTGHLAAYFTEGGVMDLRRTRTGNPTARIVTGPGQWRARIDEASQTLFAHSREGQFGIWDLSGSPDTLTEFLPLHNFTQVRTGANGTILAVRSEDGGMIAFDAETLIPLATLEQNTNRRAFRARAIDVHPTRPLLAVADKAGLVRTYDFERQRWSPDLHKLGTMIRDLAYSPSGDAVILTGTDGRVFQFADLEDPPTRILHTTQDHTTVVKAAFSRDGSRFCVNAVTTESATQLLEWDTDGGPDQAPRLLDSLAPPLGHYSVEETPDGSAWASGGRGCVRLINRAGKVTSFPLEENFERYEDLTFHPGGRRAFLGGADGSISVLDLESLDETLTWAVYNKAVHDMEWIERTGTLVTCSLTGEVKLHRIGRAGRCLPADRVRHHWQRDPSPAAIRRALETDGWLDGTELKEALRIVERLPPKSHSTWWVHAHYARLLANGITLCSPRQIEDMIDRLLVVRAWRPDRTIDALPSLLFEARRYRDMLRIGHEHQAVQEARQSTTDYALCFQALAADALGDTVELERIARDWVTVRSRPTRRLHLVRIQALARALVRPDGRPWLPRE